MNLFGTWMEAKLDSAKMMINTVDNKDFDVNVMYWIKRNNPKMITITETGSLELKEKLVKQGYSYVLLEEEAEWDVLKQYLKKTHMIR